MCHSGREVYSGVGCAHVGKEISLSSAQFSFKPKTPLKSYLLKKSLLEFANITKMNSAYQKNEPLSSY